MLFGKKDKETKKVLITKKAVAKEPLQKGPSKALKEKITEIKKITEPNIEELELRQIKEPYSYVRLTYDHNKHEYFYEVIEPTLNEKEQETLEFVKDTLIRTLEYGMKEETIGQRTSYLKENIDKILKARNIILDEVSKERINYYIVRDFIGYGKIEVLMIDSMIEDISCDGPKTPLFIYHRAYENVRTNIMFKDDYELDSFVISLAQKCGKQISVADPILDATMPDGSRLQSTYSKEVTDGSSFTIRRFKENPLTPPDLVRLNTMSAEMAAYLWLAVQHGESMLVCGGTASGKTTALNASLLFIPPQMKIVSIEDTREINLPHENWIAGCTRTGFTKGEGKSGEIDMFELLKAALRQRPQYLIVGEVRGKEAHILFQAMATGHVTYSTFHAEAPELMVQRLEGKPIELPRVSLNALDMALFQIHTKVRDRTVRRVERIIEIVGIDSDTGELITNTLFQWNSANDTFSFLGTSYLFEKIMQKKNITMEEMREEYARRVDIIKWMVKKNIRVYLEVANIITAYYKEPEEIIKKVRTELQ